MYRNFSNTFCGSDFCRFLLKIITITRIVRRPLFSFGYYSRLSNIGTLIITYAPYRFVNTVYIY